MTATPRAPLPPDPLPQINLHQLPAGYVLHRNHLSAFRSGEFNPGLGGAMRFSPFWDGAGDCVPSLYAATTREAAAYESVFHDINLKAPFKTVKLDGVLKRSVSRIELKRPVKLAALFTPDLGALRLHRTDLIDTPRSHYGRTALWAKAIHDACAEAEGLIWTSRRCDPAMCAIFFGDRVKEADFNEIDCLDLSTHSMELLELRSFGRRSGITLVS
jgi:hypothetical protein